MKKVAAHVAAEGMPPARMLLGAWMAWRGFIAENFLLLFQRIFEAF
jgi:hypothetical protein